MAGLVGRRVVVSDAANVSTASNSAIKFSFMLVHDAPPAWDILGIFYFFLAQ